MSQSPSTLQPLLKTLLLVVIAALLWKWYNALEWAEKTEIVPTQDMRSNPMLATKVWLEYTDREVVAINRVDHQTNLGLEKANAAIIWGNINYFTTNHLEDLVDFVKSGGHLLFEVPDGRIDTFNHFPLISELGIVPWGGTNPYEDLDEKKNEELNENETHDSEKDNGDGDEAKLSDEDAKALLRGMNAEHIGYKNFKYCRASVYLRYPIYLPDSTAWMCLKKNKPFSLMESSKPSELIAIDEEGRDVIMATFDIEHGTVTAFSSLDHFWSRRKFLNTLLEFDHAWWLDQLLTAADHVVLIQHRYAPSLWQLIQQHLPYTAVCALLFAVIWSASLLPRFGPLKPPAISSFRALSDHLQASIQVLRRHDQIDRFIRERFDSICLHFPSLSNLSLSQKIVELATLTGSDPNAINDIVDPKAPYLHRVRRLQQLRNSL